MRHPDCAPIAPENFPNKFCFFLVLLFRPESLEPQLEGFDFKRMKTEPERIVRNLQFGTDIFHQVGFVCGKNFGVEFDLHIADCASVGLIDAYNGRAVFARLERGKHDVGLGNFHQPPLLRP